MFIRLPVGLAGGTVTRIYIHIPFCCSKCRYCSFVSFAGLESMRGRYCRAVCREITRCIDTPERPRVDSLFFGGGTPTVMETSQLIQILDCCRRRFAIDRKAEISLEANPDTAAADDLYRLRDAGFNRISFGVQSFVDRELQILGRVHDSRRAEQAVVDARAAGFENLSLDLMYGLPEQTPATWHDTMKRALDLVPDHLSAYQLSIDDGTPFAEQAAAGKLPVPGEAVVVEMDEITAEMTRAAGFEQYEISNYARRGCSCRHNLGYWHNEEYNGFGAGAVSYLDGVRAGRIKNPDTYCAAVERGEDPVESEECLGPVDSFKETVIMGLRLNRGVSEKRLQKRYGMTLAEVYGATLEKLLAEGLVELDGRLRLSERGRALGNLVMAELV